MKRLTRLLIVAGLLGLVAVPAMAQGDILPDDFCFQTTITVENAGGALTDYGVRVEMNALGLVANGDLDPRGWDMKPTAGGFSTESEVFAQDLDSSSAPWWFRLESIGAGGTQTYRIYTGNDEQKRNNGIFFTGGDEVTVPSHVDFDLTDDIAITVMLELDDATPQNATLISRWNDDEGYKIELENDAGTLKIVSTIDDKPGKVTWNPLWTGETIRIRAVFNAPTLETFVNEVSGDSTNTTLGAATATSTAVLIGTDLVTTVIRRASIRENAGGAEAIVARWGLHAGETGAVGCTEASDADPIYTGTCQDSGPGNHDATYRFDRDQSDLTVTVGPTALGAAPLLVLFEGEIPDTLGDPFADTLFDPALVENSRFFGYEFALPFVEDMGVPRQMGWSMILGFLGLLLLMGVWAFSRNVPLALAAGLIPPFFGVINNWIEPWVLVVWITMAVVLFGTHRWAEQS